jgi:hypothetical protein
MKGFATHRQEEKWYLMVLYADAYLRTYWENPEDEESHD